MAAAEAVYDEAGTRTFYTMWWSSRRLVCRGHPEPGLRQTVSDAIRRFKELGNDGRRLRSGRKYSVNSSRNCKAIEKRVQRNPRVSMRYIAHDM
ncbi:hypothetical protein TNCV_2268691 [Trichonephila clavipes]|nr:hypothetical protein TNCV_2268691 [Trichonephila clavipes]